MQSRNQNHRLIDFDEWMALAENDPEAFEVRREELIEQHLQRIPEARRQRLRCLQWRIDQIRHTSGSPLGATIRLHRMMWDSLVGEGGLYGALESLLDGKDLPVTQNAQILQFPGMSAG